MNSVLKSRDGKDLILTCTCGCGDTIHFRMDRDDPDYYFCMSYMSGNWYRDQNESAWSVLRRKVTKIWRIIRNKDHHYSDIRMNGEDFELFREYVNSVGRDSKDDKVSVLYICDKQYCEDCDNPECEYTTDIAHAANFMNIGNNEWVEKGE